MLLLEQTTCNFKLPHKDVYNIKYELWFVMIQTNINTGYDFRFIFFSSFSRKKIIILFSDTLENDICTWRKNKSHIVSIWQNNFIKKYLHTVILTYFNYLYRKFHKFSSTSIKITIRIIGKSPPNVRKPKWEQQYLINKIVYWQQRDYNELKNPATFCR